MQLIKPDININFVGLRYKAFILSGAIILFGMLTLFMRGGLRMGVDFAGGTLIQVKFNKPTSPDEIRKALQGIVSHAFVQEIGASGDSQTWSAPTPYTRKWGASQTRSRMSSAKPTVRAAGIACRNGRAKVGHDLRQKALYAIFYALLLIAIYISGRFEFKWTSSLIMGGVLVVGIYLLEAIWG